MLLLCGPRFARQRVICRHVASILLVVALMSAVCCPRGVAYAVASPEYAVYVQSGVVWLSTADGNEPQALSSEGVALEAALSPDGRRVAYLLAPDEVLGQAPLPSQVWLADLTTGEQRPLTPTPAQRSQLVWAPNSGLIALIEDDHLVVLGPLAGASVMVLDAPARDGLDYAGYAWLPNSQGLVALQGSADPADATAQRVVLVGQGNAAFPLHIDEAVSAVSMTPRAATALAVVSDAVVSDAVVSDAVVSDAVSLLTERGGLWSVSLADGRQTRLAPADVAVAAYAWSPDGTRLAYADRANTLWLATPSDGLAARRLATLPAPAASLDWPADDRIAATMTVGGGTAAFTVDISPGGGAAGVHAAGLPEAVAAQAAPVEPPSLADVDAPYEWYRYQGAADSGACASVNCGPTSVAMAIEFAKNDLYVAISAVRDYIGGECDGTNSTQLRAALSNWGVPYQNINGMSALREAVNTRGHIVLVPVVMGAISPGADYEVWNSNPSQNTGRYYSYSGGHWLVVKGFTADGAWVRVYDPNVWESGKYRYADGTLKGKNRLYAASEFATAFQQNSNWAIEVMAAPSLAPAVPANLQASAGTYLDRVELTWSASSGATFYTVTRAATADGEPVYLANPTTPKWVDTQPPQGVHYFYWVSACNPTACSAAAGPVEGYRAQDQPPRAWVPTACCSSPMH